jgi:hypothetical protein
MKVADKATDNSREKVTKQLATRLLLSSSGSKATDRVTNKVPFISREEADEAIDWANDIATTKAASSLQWRLQANRWSKQQLLSSKGDKPTCVATSKATASL